MLLAFALKELATSVRLAKGGTQGIEHIKQAEIEYDLAEKKDPLILATIHNDFGGFYLAKNNLEEAVSRYKAALTYYEKPNSRTYGYSHVLINYGKIHILRGHASKALDILDKAIKVQTYTTGKNTVTYVVTIQLKANALELAGDLKEANALYKEELYLLESRKFRTDLLAYVKESILRTSNYKE